MEEEIFSYLNLSQDEISEKILSDISKKNIKKLSNNHSN